MNTLIDLTGKRFGKLVVREKLPPQEDGRTRWLCDCAYSYALRKKNQSSCGCGKIKDIVGMRFGHLVVLKRSNQYIDTVDRGKKYLWECRCDCGQTVFRLSEKLRDDANCSCKSCMEKSAVNAMVNSAGFVEGTQISKLVRTSPNANSTSGVRGVFLISAPANGELRLSFKGNTITSANI